TVGRLPEAQARPRRRRWRLLLGILLVVVLGLAALYGFVLYEADRELREAMAEADGDCPGGWLLNALEAGREEVPDEENAALVVMKVKSLLSPNWPAQLEPTGQTEQEGENGAGADELGRAWVDKLLTWPPEVQLPAAQLRRLRASLAQVEPARA